ncbi:hypothetical protein Neosp_012075 [[Neocosmospora] mangrovei]
MAEAISLVASVAGLLDVATRAFSALHNLQTQLRNAPDLIRALSNEASDLKAVLARVDDVRRNTEATGFGTPDGSAALDDLEAQLCKAKFILADLDALAQKLLGENMTLKRVKWCLKKSRASELQTRLKEVRLKINELLVAHNTQVTNPVMASLISNCKLQDVRLDVHHSRTVIVQRLEENKPDGSRLGSSDSHTSMGTEQGGHQASATEPQHEGRHSESPMLEQEAGERIAIIQRLVSDVLAQQTLRASQIDPQYPVSVGPTPVSTYRPEFLNSVLFTYAFPLWFLNYAIHGLIDTTERFTLAIVPRRRMEYYLSPMNILYQVQVGTMENIRHILQVNKSAVIEVYYGDDRSVLHLALVGPLPWTTKLEIIKLLLISGADPDQEDIFGTSARQQVGRMLLSRDEPLEYLDELEKIFPLSGCIDDLGLTFLHKIVVGHCHVDLVPILESQSQEIVAQLDAKDGSGHTPLMYAAERGDLPKARALVKAGADVNIKSSGGSSALGFALGSDMSESTCLELVDLFLEAGTDIDMVDERQGRNFMHYAAERNNASAVKRLLAAGAKIDPQTAKMPATPLAFAARYNAVDVLQLLYEEGADINASQNNGITPLLMAVGFNAHQGQAMLLRLGADYLRDSQGTTVLHAAAESGDEKTLETQASFGLKGLNVEARDKNGLTAREEFETREQPVTEEVRAAFYRLLEVVASHSSENDGQESGSSDDEFVDASEYGQEEGT